MNENSESPLLFRYQKAYEENPGSRVFAPLAEVYRKMGMLDKAQEILLKGIKEHPDYVFGHMGLAHCYMDLSQYQDAYEVLSPFVETFRDNIKLQKVFGECCLQLRKNEQALETYKYLLFLNPKDEQAAKVVKDLEERVVEQEAPLQLSDEQFVEEEVTEKPSKTFNIDKLESNPDDFDYDDWRQEDFTFSQNFGSQSDEDWKMDKDVSESLPEEEEREFHVDPALIEESEGKEVEEDLEEESGPVITHTLVDLYCSQGHLDKAKEILEKILLLNPQDQKTRERLDELSLLVQEGPADTHIEEEDLVDIEESEFVKSQQTPEQSQPQDLMDYFDQKVKDVNKEDQNSILLKRKEKLEKFLSRLQDRSFEKSKGSVATP